MRCAAHSAGYQSCIIGLRKFIQSSTVDLCADLWVPKRVCVFYLFTLSKENKNYYINGERKKKKKNKYRVPYIILYYCVAVAVPSTMAVGTILLLLILG